MLRTKRLFQRCSGVNVAQFVRAVVKLEKKQQIKASCKTFFAVRSTVEREYRRRLRRRTATPVFFRGSGRSHDRPSLRPPPSFRFLQSITV